MTFHSPTWFWALALLVPALLARVWSSLEARDAVDSLVAPRLRDDLVTGGGHTWGWLRFVIHMLALAALVTALARPQWGEKEREVFGEGRSIIIAIDTSRSMLADDIKPNRLTRAKLAAYDLVSALPGDMIGLIAFAGGAFVQVPVSADSAALNEAIEQLDTYAVARGGTNIAAAIKLASSSLKDSGAARHALIIFTDGENLEGEALEEAENAASDGMVIVTVGVGTAGGSMIPDPDSKRPGGGFIKDSSGEIVRTKLDVESLEKIARAADGLFLQLDEGAMNTEMIQQMLSQLESTAAEAGTRTEPIERFQWPLGVALLLMLIALFVRPRITHGAKAAPATAAAAAAALAFALAAPPAVQAGMISDAYANYREGAFEQSYTHFQDALADEEDDRRKRQLQLGFGSSAYRLGKHEVAREAFADALVSDEPLIQEQAHYGLGNTLFRMGEAQLTPPEADESKPDPQKSPDIEAVLRDWRGALEHFEASFEHNPDNADTAYNIDIVRRRIEELEKQQQEQQRQQQEEKEQQDQPENSEQPEDPEEQQDKPPEENGENEGSSRGEGEPSPDRPEGEIEEATPAEGVSEQEGEQRPSETEGERGGESGVTENEPVDPETGYSRGEARRQLEALANEQVDLQPIRRRVRARYFQDW